MKKPVFVNIIGGGLAGSEAAYQLAIRGINVRLFEMRPLVKSPAHKTGNLAELVCSNTFKSVAPHSAHGIFKNELLTLNSLVISTAPLAQVPAGEALAVDREIFSKEIEKKLLNTNRVERLSLQVDDISQLPEADFSIIATGPLTQGKLFDTIQSLSDGKGLYFYDAIAPILDADTIDRSIAFSASRYGKGTDDYLNCPMTKEEYLTFYHALQSAEKVSYNDFETAQHFQGCQPIEAIAETGIDSLRFGPMKPVGLTDPRNGKRPYAVVQLRIDDISRSSYNIVGFQTRLKYPEQKKVFSLIPGLQNVEILRFGSMHRNTYICTPTFLDKSFSLKTNRKIKFAGQITGVEGYTESSAIGLLTALAIYAESNGNNFTLPPKDSFLGSLCTYLFESDPNQFQPMNTHFGMIANPTLIQSTKKCDKKEFRANLGKQFVQNIKSWFEQFT